jgi:transcriptional regulator with XRE-family HTH domain
MAEPLSDAARTLGERIRDQRTKLALSQEEIAHLADMNGSNYGKIERGLGNPNFHTILQIAAVLGVDPGSLVTGLFAPSGHGKPQVFTAVEFVRERRAHQTQAL